MSKWKLCAMKLARDSCCCCCSVFPLLDTFIWYSVNTGIGTPSHTAVKCYSVNWLQLQLVGQRNGHSCLRLLLFCLGSHWLFPFRKSYNMHTLQCLDIQCTIGEILTVAYNNQNVFSPYTPKESLVAFVFLPLVTLHLGTSIKIIEMFSFDRRKGHMSMEVFLAFTSLIWKVNCAILYIFKHFSIKMPDI